MFILFMVLSNFGVDRFNMIVCIMRHNLPSMETVRIINTNNLDALMDLANGYLSIAIICYGSQSSIEALEIYS
jgi:hypothetical protein